MSACFESICQVHLGKLFKEVLNKSTLCVDREATPERSRRTRRIHNQALTIHNEPIEESDQHFLNAPSERVLISGPRCPEPVIFITLQLNDCS